MHEMSLCESILSVCENSAREQGFAQVKTVWLEIGVLSNVDWNAILFCFDVVRRDTLAADAQLQKIDIPAKAWCFGCGTSVDITQRHEACPECGSYQLQVNGGDDMKIKELEVE